MNPPRQVALGFAAFVDDLGGPDDAAFRLQVSRRQIDEWLFTGPTYAVAVAAWCLSQWGDSAAHADAHNRIQLVCMRADIIESENRALTARLAVLQSIVDAIGGAANDADAGPIPSALLKATVGPSGRHASPAAGPLLR